MRSTPTPATELICFSTGNDTSAPNPPRVWMPIFVDWQWRHTLCTTTLAGLLMFWLLAIGLLLSRWETIGLLWLSNPLTHINKLERGRRRAQWHFNSHFFLHRLCIKIIWAVISLTAFITVYPWNLISQAARSQKHIINWAQTQRELMCGRN